MKEKTKHFLILLGILIGVQFAHAQTTLSGRVFDAKTKQPLAGASVFVDNNSVSIQGEQTGTVQNISIGAVTDKDGKFSFKSSVNLEGKRLVVSYMGFVTQRLTITDNRLLSIYLEEDGAVMLQDVVLTGYQSINRKKSTGAISKIKTEDIKQAGVMGVDQMLTGQVAGVVVSPTGGAPGSAAQIRIRGNASINGVQEPLWVVDGIPLETNTPKLTGKDIEQLQNNSIAGINPNDIENITILKDAAATAIYGARAANGVIVITTKSGKKGDRLNVSYRNNLSYTAKPDISRLNLLNSTQKIDLELDLFKSNYTPFQEYGGVSAVMKKYGVTSQNLATLGYQNINALAREEIEALRSINTDWNDVLFRSAYTQDHSLSLSGGSDKSTYYFSGGYFDENGATKGTNAKRYTFNTKADFDLLPKLKLSVGLMFNQRNQTSFLSQGGATSPVYYSRTASPYQSLYNIDGTFSFDANVANGNNPSNFNALEEMNNTSNNLGTRAINMNTKLSYEPITGLVLSSQLGLQLENTLSEKLALKDSYFTRFVAYNQANYFEAGQRKTFLPDGGILTNGQVELEQYTLKNIAEYNKSFGEKHQITFMLGNELRRVETGSDYMTKFGYDPETLVSVPLTSLGTSDKTQSIVSLYRAYPNTKSFNEDAFVSFFGTTSYTYASKYTLTGSVRYDGSNMFGVAVRDRFQPLWSVGGLWRIAEEDFFKSHTPWLNLLNFRASYGLQGNLDRNTSPVVVAEYTNEVILPGGTKIPGAFITNPPNPNLTWEKTQNINIGLDIELLRNRFAFSVDAYDRLGTDLLSQKSLPLENGFRYLNINWASMRNRGLEFNLNTKNIESKNFKWSTNFNIAYNANKILEEVWFPGSLTPSRVGLPVNSIFSYNYAGVDANGIPMLKKEDGTTQSAKEFFQLNDSGVSSFNQQQVLNLMSYAGTRDPKFSGGLNNTFKVHDFDLTFGFIFNLGQKVLINPYYSPYSFNRGLNTSNQILNRFDSSTKTGDLPALVDPSTTTNLDAKSIYTFDTSMNFYGKLDYWVRKNDYIRLRNVNLAYNLPKSLCTRLGISQLRVNAELRNLFVIADSYVGSLDPETMGNNYAQPIPKTISLGLNVGF
ncbi:MAG: SusC/RagA family TonB-linked outer membrane protein [Sphingobacteriaceae bacterium]|nr:SusC/RagA family TonB-linked outer membrane protein [Sphingobacteriaceae bacterium]